MQRVPWQILLLYTFFFLEDPFRKCGDCLGIGTLFSHVYHVLVVDHGNHAMAMTSVRDIDELELTTYCPDSRCSQPLQAESAKLDIIYTVLQAQLAQ